MPSEGQTPGQPQHPNDYGTEVPNIDYPGPPIGSPCGHECCECRQKGREHSPTGSTNLGRPTGPAGGVHPNGIPANANCRPGEVRTFRYEGVCVPNDQGKKEGFDCSGKTCNFYVRWRCSDKGNTWGSVDETDTPASGTFGP